MLEIAPESLPSLQRAFERRALVPGEDWRAFGAVTDDGMLALGDAPPVAVARLRDVWSVPLAEVFG